MSYLVESDGVSVDFTSKGGKLLHAVIDFSFGVEAGECLAIVGESGSGKSTLLRALMGLVPPSAGIVRLFGNSLAELSPRELALTRLRCGYVPQDPYGALPPSMSALSAVIEPSVIARSRGVGNVSHEEAQKRARTLLAELGLAGDAILSSRPAGLSGGQRQRVEIARALMNDPELMLCDEPTSMQDVSTRGDIIEVLRSRVSLGMALVFVTHDLHLASRVASRITVMHHGRMCEHGRAEDILNRPKHPYTVELLEAMPKLPE